MYSKAQAKLVLIFIRIHRAGTRDKQMGAKSKGCSYLYKNKKRNAKQMGFKGSIYAGSKIE